MFFILLVIIYVFNVHVQLYRIIILNYRKDTTFYLHKYKQYKNMDFVLPFTTWLVSVSAIFVILQLEINSIVNIFPLQTVSSLNSCGLNVVNDFIRLASFTLPFPQTCVRSASSLENESERVSFETTRKSKARISRAVISPRYSLLRQHVLPASVVGKLRKTNFARRLWLNFDGGRDVTTDACSVSLLICVHTRLFTTAPKATEIVQRDTLEAVTYGRLGKFLRPNRDHIIKRHRSRACAIPNLL